jgi:hypothetical protein
MHSRSHRHQEWRHTRSTCRARAHLRMLEVEALDLRGGAGNRGRALVALGAAEARRQWKRSPALFADSVDIRFVLTKYCGICDYMSEPCPVGQKLSPSRPRRQSSLPSAASSVATVRSTLCNLSRPNKPRRKVLKPSGSSHCSGTPAAICSPAARNAFPDWNSLLSV